MCGKGCGLGETKGVVVVLVVLFAVSSWVDINGLWVELPILTQQLPEGWNLPSYMAVIIQVANIAPLLYTLSSVALPQRSFEVPVIYLIIAVGGVACLLLAFLWDATAEIGGQLHSVGLLSLQFFLALVDCTSSVAYLPFMGLFKPQYLTAFYIGEGFSGLLPSLLSLVQGAGQIRCVNQTSMRNISRDGSIAEEASFSMVPVYETPRFSVRVFFFFLFSMMVVSLVAFTLLNFWPYVSSERVKEPAPRDSPRPSQPSASFSATSQNSAQYSSQRCDDPWVREGRASGLNSTSPLLEPPQKVYASSPPETPSIDVEVITAGKKLGMWQYAAFLFLTAWVNALANGVLPSIQSYSCLPYGINAYHLSVSLSSIANPIACFVTFFVSARSLRSVVTMSVVGSALGGYILYTAATSPVPPLHQHFMGPIIVVSAWILVVFTLTFTKVSIAGVLREEGRRALLWVGALTQVGSLLGALAVFFLVNFYTLFQQANPCV